METKDVVAISGSPCRIHKCDKDNPEIAEASNRSGPPVSNTVGHAVPALQRSCSVECTEQDTPKLSYECETTKRQLFRKHSDVKRMSNGSAIYATPQKAIFHPSATLDEGVDTRPGTVSYNPSGTTTLLREAPRRAELGAQNDIPDRKHSSIYIQNNMTGNSDKSNTSSPSFLYIQNDTTGSTEYTCTKKMREWFSTQNPDSNFAVSLQGSLGNSTKHSSETELKICFDELQRKYYLNPIDGGSDGVSSGAYEVPAVNSFNRYLILHSQKPAAESSHRQSSSIYDALHFEQMQRTEDAIRVLLNQRRCTRAIVTFNIILAALFSVVIGLVFLFRWIDPSIVNVSSESHHKELCMTTSELRAIGIEYSTNGTGISTDSVCFEKLFQLFQLFEAFNKTIEQSIDRKLRSVSKQQTQNARGSPNTDNPLFAHVIADRSDPTGKDALGALPLKRPLFYSHDVDWHSGIDIKDSKLIIPEAGIYFIYSHVQFTSNYGAKKRKGPVYHRINRYNTNLPNGGVHTLMKASVGPYYHPNFRHPSYVSAILPLYNGDEIFISVTDNSLVDLDEKASYLGVYKLANLTTIAHAQT